MERGIVYNPERNRQLKDFSGLRYGKITPTDLDGLIDFGARAFVYMELKYAGARMDRGQELAIERIVDDHRRPSIGIVASHNAPENEAIDVASCAVSRIRFGKRWIPVRQPITVRQMTDRFLLRFAPEYLSKDR